MTFMIEAIDHDGWTLLSHVLYYQFISVPEIDAIFKVKNGTGMGQHVSGEIADWYFYKYFEERDLELCKTYAEAA